MSEALAAQKANPKKIFIDFYADWCEPCKIMDQKTYANPIIAEQLNKNFYPVKFNAEEGKELRIYEKIFANPKYISGKRKNTLHDFAKYMNVSTLPATVFLDERGAPITILNGLLLPKEIEPYLKMMYSDAYKKIRTKAQWDDYQKKFSSQIKE